jgi:hypothetical protein
MDARFLAECHPAIEADFAQKGLGLGGFLVDNQGFSFSG